MKADFYPVGEDALAREALARRQRYDVGGATIFVAPPEYVIVRKLEFHREGGSDKHLRDIASLLASGRRLDMTWLQAELERRGLTTVWAGLTQGPADEDGRS